MQKQKLNLNEPTSLVYFFSRKQLSKLLSLAIAEFVLAGFAGTAYRNT